jgi:ATP-binding cassette subfamily B protein
MLQLALASAERVFAVLDEDEEHDRDNAGPAAAIQGDIEMQRVDFSYPSSAGAMPGKKVLRDANISASSGQTVAIVGPTGAGKTTIINLLTKFYDFDSGSITIDGKDIRDITRESLRRSIAMVLQDTFLFSDTIRENIRYGRPSASNDEVEQAARKAHAHEFIAQLSKGYDTVLADNGQNLSQGQRQLISIARAIVSKASVLILDEATSSIDTRTELLIQNALLELMKGKTSFVIAHRLSTIRNADKILVINDGHVVEQGTHNKLLADGGFYAQLYNSQFKGIAI